MTAQITLPPVAPSRADRNTFATRADAWVAWQEDNLVPEMNTALVEINNNATIAQQGYDAATVALAAANFKGDWSTLTGALTVPSSVYYNGAYWMLLSNIADVTTKVPGVAPEWALIKTTNALPWFQASASITAGSAVAIDSTGKVATPAITAAAAGTSTAITTAAYGSICYLPEADKFVLAAHDGTNVKARVGTQSGTTITWGTISSTIGASAAAKHGICAVGNNKVVVTYAPTANSVYAAVGTVSGTTITFGTSVQIVNTASCYVDRYSITYDPDSDRVVIVYQNGSGANNFAVAGAVSGTTITFGTPVDLGAGSGAQNCQIISLQGNGGKCLYAYHNSSSTYYSARLLSISGSTITLGSVYTWVIPSTSLVPIRVAFDTFSRKVIATGCSPTANIGIASVITISNDEVYFGTSRTFSSSGISNGGGVPYNYVYYDPSAKTCVLLYGDLGNSNYGTMVSGSIDSGQFLMKSKTVFYSGTVQYLNAAHSTVAKKAVVIYGDTSSYSVITPYSSTATNFIGFAQSAASTNEYLKIATSQYVDENQTGLTPSAKYYIADNGALTTTVTETFAGTAVGTTRLLVKG